MIFQKWSQDFINQILGLYVADLALDDVLNVQMENFWGAVQHVEYLGYFGVVRVVASVCKDWGSKVKSAYLSGHVVQLDQDL